MTTPKEALERLRRDMLMYIDAGVADDDLSHTVKVSHINFVQWHDLCDAAIASLESGDARERIAQALLDRFNQRSKCRSIGGAQPFPDGTKVSSLPASYRDDFYADADAILATGLVPDEAAIRADERERCARIADLAGFQHGDNASRAAMADKIAAAIRAGRDE